MNILLGFSDALKRKKKGIVLFQILLFADVVGWGGRQTGKLQASFKALKVFRSGQFLFPEATSGTKITC